MSNYARDRNPSAQHRMHSLQAVRKLCYEPPPSDIVVGAVEVLYRSNSSYLAPRARARQRLMRALSAFIGLLSLYLRAGC